MFLLIPRPLPRDLDRCLPLPRPILVGVGADVEVDVPGRVGPDQRDDHLLDVRPDVPQDIPLDLSQRCDDGPHGAQRHALDAEVGPQRRLDAVPRG
ncbi:hypothetical protein CH063_13643, partial [Colletotrichum higginsianum]